jgi:hypothetical protein
MEKGGSMRKLAICFATFCMLAAPVAADPKQQDHAAEHVIIRKPASGDELAGYAQRERVAEKLQKFEGGRGMYIEATTLVIILLIIILILILI